MAVKVLNDLSVPAAVRVVVESELLPEYVLLVVPALVAESLPGDVTLADDPDGIPINVAELAPVVWLTEPKPFDVPPKPLVAPLSGDVADLDSVVEAPGTLPDARVGESVGCDGDCSSVVDLDSDVPDDDVVGLSVEELC